MTDMLRRISFGALATLLGLAPLGCASTGPSPASTPAVQAAPAPAASPSPAAEPAAPAPAATRPPEPPYPSTYQPLPSQPVLITNATILTAAGDRIGRGSVLLRDGKVAAVGASVEAPAGVTVVDGTGKWVTPG